ncbi:hypothetical protein QA601_06720 [Chitinispirillales bacterium ANBcel5]|uniref:hypothetical protein n=1 Tax=Cellulosispirillum alkaliphilum TaxID=3039283 RepID=UPI002A52DDD3|nr:hypothetical protein [Chitinispirillales bacterium ANBcel5]
MKNLKKGVIISAVPLTVLGISGIIAKKTLGHKNGKVSHEIKEAANESVQQINNAVSELKEDIEKKNAPQLERSIDSIVQNTKNKIDKIGEQLKNKIHQQQLKSRLSHQEGKRDS